MTEEVHEGYYVPPHSILPFLTAVSLFCLGYGAANLLHANLIGHVFFFGGALILAGVMFVWFREVIREHKKGYFDTQVDRSFRWGMAWFIFSEVAFFSAFFFALFYVRLISVPALSGHGVSANVMTHLLLWPDFKGGWPLLTNPNEAQFPSPENILHTWGIPALNTLILLSSAVTVTWAHWELKAAQRRRCLIGLSLTILLGIAFLGFQIHEYLLAYNEYNLRLTSGIYGSTFFMLTGFHGAHVTIGVIMLTVILVRTFRGHFKPDDHFAFEASAWYWHFVDVIWLFLFVFVYWL